MTDVRWTEEPDLEDPDGDDEFRDFPESGLPLSLPAEAAFTVAFGQHRLRLLEYATRYIDPDTAEDAVQRTFISLWKVALTDPGYVLDGRPLRGLLLTILRNDIIDLLRRRAARKRWAIGHYAPLVGAIRIWMDPEAAALARELLSLLRRLVKQLPPRCRQVLMMTRGRGMSTAEVAARLGIAPRTVRIHLARAMMLLAGPIAAAGFDVPGPTRLAPEGGAEASATPTGQETP